MSLLPDKGGCSTPSAADHYAVHRWHSHWNDNRRPLLAYRLLSNFDLIPRLLEGGRYFLDLGCGAAASVQTAVFSRCFERRVFVDLSLEGVVQTRQRYGDQAMYVAGDARCPPFRDGVFDQVYSAMMFQHVECGDKGQHSVVREMRHVGGRVVLTTTQGREGPLLRPVRRLLPQPPLFSRPLPVSWFERAGGNVSTYRLLPNTAVRGGLIGWLTVGLARWLERMVPPSWAHYITVCWDQAGNVTTGAGSGDSMMPPAAR